ncbi:hypothetical protein ACVWZR_002309 [Bradyrhizobium sp. i1.3.1]
MPSHRVTALFVAALVCTTSLSSSGLRAQTTVTSAPPASFTLSNGLQVVVIRDHRTPVVTEMISGTRSARQTRRRANPVSPTSSSI